MKPITWKNVRVPLGKLAPWVHNPREITQEQAERLGGSMEEFGQVDVFAIGPKFDVYNGHQRLGVLLSKHGPKYMVDCRQSSRALTEKERQKLTVLLHATATGQWNWDALSSWEGMDLSEWGFNKSTLKAWKADVNALGNFLASGEGESEDPGVGAVDRAAELQVKWNTKVGQLWKLGNHRLLIGDCTVQENVDRLMGEERAVLMLTDPPYGVDYGELVRGRENQKQGGWDDIKNDALSDEALQSLLTLSLHGAGANVGFVFHPPGERRWLFWSAVKDNGWTVSQEIVWVKNAMVFGRADYQWRHEPCIYLKKAGARKKQEDRTQTTVWEVKKPTSSIHPTQKPVELFEIAVRNHTEQGELVYEPFAGSGTTIIAAENLSRRCYAMEISPKYGAVILERWSMQTGKKPVLEGKNNGKAKTKKPQ
jgi:DNA modification methylase